MSAEQVGLRSDEKRARGKYLPPWALIRSTILAAQILQK